MAIFEDVYWLKDTQGALRRDDKSMEGLVGETGCEIGENSRSRNVDVSPSKIQVWPILGLNSA